MSNSYILAVSNTAIEIYIFNKKSSVDCRYKKVLEPHQMRPDAIIVSENIVVHPKISQQQVVRSVAPSTATSEKARLTKHPVCLAGLISAAVFTTMVAIYFRQLGWPAFARKRTATCLVSVPSSFDIKTSIRHAPSHMIYKRRCVAWTVVGWGGAGGLRGYGTGVRYGTKGSLLRVGRQKTPLTIGIKSPPRVGLTKTYI